MPDPFSKPLWKGRAGRHEAHLQDFKATQPQASMHPLEMDHPPKASAERASKRACGSSPERKYNKPAYKKPLDYPQTCIEAHLTMA